MPLNAINHNNQTEKWETCLGFELRTIRFVTQASTTMTTSNHDSTDHYAELHFNVFFILLTTTNPRLSIIYSLTQHLIHSLGACAIRRALLCYQGHQPYLTVTGFSMSFTLSPHCSPYYIPPPQAHATPGPDAGAHPPVFQLSP